MTDDRELWDRICRRDATAFEELYRTYSAGLQAFLRRALSSHQAAEDATQETFASIWRHPNGFDPARGTLRSYLFGAGRKRAVEWWPSKSRSVKRRLTCAMCSRERLTLKLQAQHAALALIAKQEKSVIAKI